MAITLSNTFVNALLAHSATAGQSALADQIGGGTVVIYSGTAPAGPNTALSGNTVLATFTLSASTSQGAASGGSMNLAFSATTVTASASGTATFFRMLNSTPAALIQGTVGTSGADFNLTNTTIASGDSVSFTGTPSISWPVA
jgi:hypothetical protein